MDSLDGFSEKIYGKNEIKNQIENKSKDEIKKDIKKDIKHEIDTSLFLRWDAEERALYGTWLYRKPKTTQKYYQRLTAEFFAMYKNFEAPVSIKTATFAHASVFIKRKMKNGLAPSTINTTINAVSSLFSFAQKAGLISKNPFAIVEKQNLPDLITSKILHIDQIEAIIRREPNPRNKLILRLLFYSGIRVSEFLTMTKQSIVIRGDGKSQITVVGKGHKTRTVIIPTPLAKEILDSPPIWVNGKTGIMLHPQAIWWICKVAGKRIGLENFHPHAMRHNSASHALAGGANIEIVQKTLGHANLATTSRYLSGRPEKSNADFLPKV